MTRNYIHAGRFSLLATGIGLLLAPVPVSASLDAKPMNQASEQTPDPSEPQIGAEDRQPDPTPAIDEAAAEPEAAGSFDTLCGNGQGKPDENTVRKKRKGIFGMADRMASVTRKIPLVGDFLVDSANSLSQSLACRLYPEEQEQAAEATQAATRSGQIGDTVEWQSSVRENVSGSSTVSSKNQLADGTPCMILADIVIVDGEELRVSKTMCKLPGSGRYTIMTV
mgnify:FL=1|tara:strand:- start:6479 stop:7150 length:672 start_codon:yes stop_codon:yes gene_type:complete